MYQRTADEIMAADPELAILPVGSVEQHGPHLPVMTDWAIAAELGRAVAEKMNAFLLPALPISTCREQMGKKGSVWMEPVTFYRMMTDIILSLKTQGFKKVGILQCHGGIFIMTPLVRDLNAKYNPELMVANVDPCTFWPVLYREGIIETDTELHAGEVETSQILAIAPETVHMDRAVDFVPTISRPYLSYGSMKERDMYGAEMAVDALNEAFAYMSAKKPFNYSNF